MKTKDDPLHVNRSHLFLLLLLKAHRYISIIVKYTDRRQKEKRGEGLQHDRNNRCTR